MKNIVITGATSFIGLHLVRYLIKDKNNILHLIIRKGKIINDELKKLERENMSIIK